MNALGLSLVWTSLQVSLFCGFGIVLYGFARRHHPAAGAFAVFGVLATVVAISAIAFSPWPEWWTPRTGNFPRQQAISTTRIDGPMEQPRHPESAGLPDDKATGAGIFEVDTRLLRVWSSMASAFSEGAYQGPAGSVTGWHWPAWLALSVLAGGGIGLARVALGFAAVARLKQESHRIDDARVLAVLALARARLGCAGPIDLREIQAAGVLGSPVTAGWFQPMIILPGDWRRWSDLELRAVLAHEVAHVARGDFAMWLLAQIGVVLHFYNPLVHWLAGRLRLEQEMAADLCGAQFAGGSQTYLTVLARMALRQNQDTPLWAGSPFLPTRGTLMRRIEMLHAQRLSNRLSPSRIGRLALLTALALLGLGISGLRGPTSTALAEPPTAQKRDGGTSPAVDWNLNHEASALSAIDISYLPAETVAVLSVKPIHVGKYNLTPGFVQFPSVFGYTFDSKGKADSFEIEELKAVVVGRISGGTVSTDFESPIVIMRARKAYDWDKLRARIFGEAPDDVTEVSIHGQKCYRVTSEISGQVVIYFLPNDRTIVAAPEGDLERMLAADRTRRPTWYDEWSQAAKSPVAIGGTFAALSSNAMVPADSVSRLFASIGKQTELVFATLDSDGGDLNASVTAHCKSTTDAVAISQLAKLLLAMGTKEVAKLPDVPGAKERMPELSDMAGALAKVLSATTVIAEAKDARLHTKIDAALFATLLASGEKAMNREWESQKPLHVARMGRLVTALNAYHAAHGHYPPSAVIGPDGKTPHSWRVELLPYLGEQELYDRYKLDEPWNGEHNKKLIGEVPAAYRAQEAPKKGAGDYYLVTGQGTLFDGTPTPTLASVTDAQRETMLLVECVRRTAWTRPVDIEYASDREVPKLGGHFGDGFYAAFTDGSVEFLPKDTDKSTLRAMFTKAGGDEVKRR